MKKVGFLLLSLVLTLSMTAYAGEETQQMADTEAEEQMTSREEA